MNILKKFPRLSRFLKNEDGLYSLEAVIITPLIAGTIVGLFSVTEGYRTIHQNVVSTYAIGDILSRKVTAVTPTYIDGLNTLYAKMTRASGGTHLRVSAIHYNYELSRYEVQWSYMSGGGDNLTTTTVTNYTDYLPTLDKGESVIFVETDMVFNPISNFMIGSFTFADKAVTRPRYAPTLSWTGEMQDSQQLSNQDGTEDYDYAGNPV